LTSEELTAVLDRFRVERPGPRSLSEITEAQVDLVVARLAALTDAIRGGESNEATLLASRILLSDLAFVAGQFRGRANAMRVSLTSTLADLRGVMADLERSDVKPPPTPTPEGDEAGNE
jgi:hypothetical protein